MAKIKPKPKAKINPTSKTKSKPKSKPRKKKRAKKSTNFFKYLIWLIAFIGLIISLFTILYVVDNFTAPDEHRVYDSEKQDKQKLEQTKLKAQQILNKNIETKVEVAMLKAFEKNIAVDKPKIVKKEHKKEEVERRIKPTVVEKNTPLKKRKPILAIIIDDVASSQHVREIKNLGFITNMSFFPPSSRTPNTSKLASKERNYMVHLPLEAQNYSGMSSTLKVSDDYNTIKKRVEFIKLKFPRVKYINNHTGSKFTANERSVTMLIKALNRKKLNFIDSRTTAKTKVQKVMKLYNRDYIARDIFLDHKADKSFIINQMKKVVKKAKKRGRAIAICHPRTLTLKTLKDYSYLFRDVELVYIDRFYSE